MWFSKKKKYYRIEWPYKKTRLMFLRTTFVLVYLNNINSFNKYPLSNSRSGDCKGRNRFCSQYSSLHHARNKANKMRMLIYPRVNSTESPFVMSWFTFNSFDQYYNSWKSNNNREKAIKKETKNWYQKKIIKRIKSKKLLKS